MIEVRNFDVLGWGVIRLCNDGYGFLCEKIRLSNLIGYFKVLLDSKATTW